MTRRAPDSVDHGIAARSITLRATERGLGGYVIGSIDREKVHAALDIPERYDILLILALGKPAETVVLEDAGRADGSSCGDCSPKAGRAPRAEAHAGGADREGMRQLTPTCYLSWTADAVDQLAAPNASCGTTDANERLSARARADGLPGVALVFSSRADGWPGDVRQEQPEAAGGVGPIGYGPDFRSTSVVRHPWPSPDPWRGYGTSSVFSFRASSALAAGP